jgi:hypothetical protein
MNRLGRHRIVNVQAPETFDWNNSVERSRYFSLAETTTAFFSFISALVIRRSSWLRVSPQTQFVGSCWIIAAQLCALSREQLRIRYYPGELLLKRGDNDSFMGAGIVNRIGISIDGFRKLAAHYFGTRSPEARHVSRVIKNEYTLLAMLMYKVAIDGQQDKAALEKFAALVDRHYADGLPLDFVRRNVMRTPASVLRVLIRVYRHLKPARRLARIVLSLAASGVRRMTGSREVTMHTLEPLGTKSPHDEVQHRAA